MTGRERNARFLREREARLKAGIRLQRDTSAEVRRLLHVAQREIMSVLAGAPGDYRKWQLGELQQQIAAILRAADDPATRAVAGGMVASWEAGIALVDAPLAAGGVNLSGALMALDTRTLMSMQSFTTDRIRDVTVRVANRVNDQLARTMMGMQTPWEAAEAVSGIVRDGGMRRANVIVRHNLGTAYSAAAQQRQEQAQQVVPGMQKQWRRSGKLHSRYGHDFIDGQVRDVDKPFDLPDGVQLMFPRDPAGPPGETINCGCTSLPFMAHWPASTPGRRAFTADEIAASRSKRMLAELQNTI